MAFSFEDLFYLSMKRVLPPLARLPIGAHIGVGESGAFRNGEASYGLPDWRFPRDQIPHENGSVALIHAYHFMEHLKGEDVILFLIEAQRVLMIGGVLQFCVPYYSAQIAAQDLTHKTFFTEETFRTLLDNDMYDMTAGIEGVDPRHTWKLRVHYQVIAGIVERNLALMGQIVRTL